MSEALVVIEDDLYEEVPQEEVPPFRMTSWARASDIDAALAEQGRDGVEPCAFPAGPYECGVLYIEHPVVRGRWYPAADFHRLVFEDKLAEALELAAALGATTVEAQHLAGWGEELAGTVGVKAVATVGGGRRTKGSAGSTFSASYEPAEPPASWDALLAAGSFHWLPYEPLWEPIVRGRVARRLRSCSLAVTFEQDHGIDGRLEGVVAELGLALGGSFTEHRKTEWRLQLAFG